VGGAFADAGAWRGGFWFFGAQALALALAVPLALRAERATSDATPDATPAEPPPPFPLRRLLALSAAVVAVSAGGQAAHGLAAVALVAGGVTLLVWFVRMDWAAGAARMLPARAFDPRDPVGAALLMASVLAAATVALAVYGPLVLTRVHGLSAIEAGYVVAAASVGWSVTAVAVAGSPERRDRLVIAAGVALLAVGVTGYATAILAGPVWLLALFAACDGGGFGLAWTFILRRATAFAGPADLDRLATALPTMHRLGYGVGAAWVGVVANRWGMADDADLATLSAAAQAGFVACLPVLAAGVLAAAAFLRRPLSRP
jgi:hypothetical protein